jgi:hypothetical protein
VPGQVLRADEAGRLVPADPRELVPPHLELTTISWEDFAGFLRAGQWYE